MLSESSWRGPETRGQELQAPEEKPEAPFIAVQESRGTLVGKSGPRTQRGAMVVEDAEEFIWVWVGTHDEYEKMLRGR